MTLSGLRHNTFLLASRHCQHEFFGSALYFAFAKRFFYCSQRPDLSPGIAHPAIAITEKHVGGWKQRSAS